VPRLDAPCTTKAPRPLRWPRLIRLCLIACLAWFPLGATATSDPELHVLIDVSGSMKKTDPENLRAPALRLLSDLLPEQSHVRVDLFGNRITSVLPASRANPATKAAMRESAGKIRSNEPFTDIPAALEAVNEGWSENTQRNIILLSDGKVDISPHEGFNERATRRLQDEAIPALAEAEIQVHTVALSDDADQEMLAQVADRTGGLALSARSNADLQRVFLSLFEATAPRTGVPLVENRFRVDDSISELTLVVFRAEDDQPTRIRLPGGSEIDAGQAAVLKDWRWDDSAGRDLITISNPPAGSWRILAAEDPDNRALVITDLNLAMTNLPSRVYPGETLESGLQLTNRGEPIVEPRLTDDIDAGLSVIGPDDRTRQTMELNDIGADPDVLGGDGRYDFHLVLSDTPGIYTLVGRAEGPTFERIIRKKIALAPNRPFAASFEITPPDGGNAAPAAPLLLVEQDVTILDPGSSRLDTEIRCSGGDYAQLDANLPSARNRIELPTSEADNCRLVGTIAGETEDGRQIRLPVDLKVPRPASPEPKSSTPKPAEPTADSPQAEEKTGNPLPAVLIGLAGLGVLAAIAFGWLAHNRRVRRKLISQTRA